MLLKLQKQQLLNSYLMRSKTSLMPEVELEPFAASLAEALTIGKEFKSKTPRSGMSYREMISIAAGIDIGGVEPWYRSPKVQEIIEAPLEMVKANLGVAYDKTENGLIFNLKGCAGGDEVLNYQGNGIPKSKRPFVKVLRRASSPKSSLSVKFILSAVPDKDAVLDLTGLDDEKPGHALLQVVVNGEIVFDGENNFYENDWSQMKIPILSKVLKKGDNTLEIKNRTQERIAAVADIYEAKDYYWGWFMIAEAKLDFAPGSNPVVQKAPLILDDWRKARIDLFDSTKKKISACGNWGGGSDVYVWGESRTLSDKWEDWTVSVVP